MNMKKLIAYVYLNILKFYNLFFLADINHESDNEESIPLYLTSTKSKNLSTTG